MDNEFEDIELIEKHNRQIDEIEKIAQNQDVLRLAGVRVRGKRRKT